MTPRGNDPIITHMTTNEITQTESNLRAATSILKNLRGDDDAILPSDPIVTWDGKNLLLTSKIHPLNDGEEVICDGLEGFGVGWEEGGVTAADVIQFLNDTA